MKFLVSPHLGFIPTRRSLRASHSLLFQRNAKELDTGSSGARHRTGTMEIMAIGVPAGYSHTYRHDLESFFYVFLWIIIRPNPKGGEISLSKESSLRNERHA